MITEKMVAAIIALQLLYSVLYISYVNNPQLKSPKFPHKFLEKCRSCNIFCQWYFPATLDIIEHLTTSKKLLILGGNALAISTYFCLCWCNFSLS